MFQSLISEIRDIFQILFFITVGTVTLLTYLKAKKTLLQPIRTEVFKEQVKVLSDILVFFRGKKEVDLRNEIHFDKLLTVNCISLMDDYAFSQFKLEFDIDERPYSPSLCPTSIVSKQYAEKFFILADEHLVDASSKEASDLEKDQFEWSDYVYGHVKIPKETSRKLNELDKIIDSPLIPKSLLILLEKYKDVVEENTYHIQAVLTECSQELPEKYPSIETLEKVSFSWISNRFNEEFAPLEKIAKEITDYIRNYFATDDLFS